MKKIRFIFWMTALSAAVLSCAQKEQEWEASVPQPETAPGYVYRFSLAENKTKATLNDEGVFWENEDPVGLFLGASGAPIKATVDANTDPKTVVFSTQQQLAAGTPVYTYYPYQSGSFSASSAPVTFPSAQTGGSHSAMPMAGVPFQTDQTEAGDMQGVVRFQNLGAVIDFRIFSQAHAGEQVRSITLTAKAGTNPVSGQATLNLTGVNPADETSMAVTWQGGFTQSSVTLSQIGTATIGKDVSAALGNLYMVVAPGTYSGTISVVTNAATYTFPFTNKAFERNALKRFNLNLDGPNATRTAYYKRVQSASDLVDGGTYLIAYLSSDTEAKLFHPVWRRNNYSTYYEGTEVNAVVTDQGIQSSTATDVCQVNLEHSSGTSYYMKARGDVGNYISLSNGSLTSGKDAMTVSFNNSGGVSFYRYNSYLRYNNGSFGSSYSSSYLALFKLDGIPLTAQDLQFSAYSFAYSLADNPLPVTAVTGAPVLSGAQTQVVYSSSDPQVATVDVSTGALTIQGEGQAWITATAAASETYAGAKISYRLDVTADRVFRLESEAMAAYLDYTEAHPYDPNDYTYSYVQNYVAENNNIRFDLPRPAIVEWTNPANGNTTKTVDIYNDEARSSKEMTVSVSSSATSAEVYSLIPGRRYWYVVSNGGSTLAEGSFSTAGRRRIMKVGDSPTGETNANNCRDLGGLETTDGHRLRYGKIFRGTNMDGVEKSGQKSYLLDYMHIGLDVDLRETTGKNPLGVTVSDQTYNSIGDLTNVNKMRVTISDILTHVHNGNVIYIHCKVGADRTAYVCMLLELLLGVRQELCDVDLELTSFCPSVDNGLRIRGSKTYSFYYYTLGIEYLGGKTGATLQEKAYNYVKDELGITAERITQFRTEMLESQN